MIHCDLAARNILVKKSQDSFLLKISDFGLSHVGVGEQGKIVSDAKIPVRYVLSQNLTEMKDGALPS